MNRVDVVDLVVDFVDFNLNVDLVDVDLDVDLVDVDLDDQKYDFDVSRTDLNIVDGLSRNTSTLRTAMQYVRESARSKAGEAQAVFNKEVNRAIVVHLFPQTRNLSTGDLLQTVLAT